MGLSRREALVALVSAMLALSTVMALAAHSDGPPMLIPYQAFVERNGQPVDGDVDLTLRIFDEASGGSELWIESRTDVPVFGGRLGIVLGEGTPLPEEVFDRDALWLEVEVEGTAFPSRQRVLPVPQAIASRQASSFRVTHDLRWSAGGSLADNQGGSIELGGGEGTTPYIDFHASDENDDYSTRLIANEDGLRLRGGAPGLGDGLVVDGGLSVGGTAYVGAVNAEATKICIAQTSTNLRLSTPVPDTWTPDDCGFFALISGGESNEHVLGCVFRESDNAIYLPARFSMGSPGGGIPTRNCGW